MALDPKFREETEGLVESTLELYGKAESSERISSVWGVKREGDFLCGFFVGEIVGSALSAFQAFHGREPTGEEHEEIVGIVERRARRIRELFARFN